MSDVEQVLSALWLDHHAGRSGKAASVATIRARVEDALSEASILEALAQLVADGDVARAGDDWQLATAARPRAHAAWEEVTQEGFSSWMLACQASPAYRQFCLDTNGSDIVTFGLIDEAQWEAGLGALALGPGQQALDLGCGLGAATAHVARVTGAHVHGVDFARRAIAWARDHVAGDVSFSVATLDRIEIEPEHWDAIFAFDTLYFVDDLPRLVAKIVRGLRPGGRFVAFHSVGIEAGQPEERLGPDANPLARALQAAGQSYGVRDLTAAEHTYWQREHDVATRLESAFAAEGNRHLQAGRLQESSAMLTKCAEGRQRRYLYVASR